MLNRCEDAQVLRLSHRLNRQEMAVDRRRLLPPLGQMQRRVRVVPASQQQNPAVQPVDSAERGILTQRIVQSMASHDVSGVRTQGGERDLPMAATQGAGPGPDRLGDDTHPPARRPRRVEDGCLLADHRPPGLRNGRVAPASRIGVLRCVGRRDQGAVGTDYVQTIRKRLRVRYVLSHSFQRSRSWSCLVQLR